MKENNDKESKLKLIHLVWLLLAMALTVGVAWGVALNQQSVNSKAIERKLDKETFQMYLTQQAKQDEALKALIESLNYKSF
ncbi:MAG: hypothetical protein ACYST6_21320 [Planctomycetota bacterium]|jgi:lipopolysaccharide export system protein LptC